MKASPNFSAAYDLLSRKALETALAGVPAYQSWRAFDPGPAESTDRRFEAMPALSKEDLRKHSWRGFVPHGRNIDLALQKGVIELVQTSGTTKERVTNIWFQQWWDESEASSWRCHKQLAALPLGPHREAILTSPLNAGILSNEKLLSMPQRTQGRFLYLNEKAYPTMWDDQIIERMLRELEIFRPLVLEANPSYLAIVARYADRRRRAVFQPGVIILTYENPGLITRKHIRRAFQAPLVSSYGSTEAGYVLLECDQGKLHQVSPSCRIDVEYLRVEHGQPGVGRLLLTTLTNPWRSLIKFDVGDLVEIEPRGSCACGRTDGYISSRIAGRTADLSYTPDGRPVLPAAVETALAGMEEVIDYQLRQQAGRCDVAVVLDQEINAAPSLREEISKRLRPLYGCSDTIKVHFAAQIKPESSGKYRRVRSDIALDDDKLFMKSGPSQVRRQSRDGQK